MAAIHRLLLATALIVALLMVLPASAIDGVLSVKKCPDICKCFAKEKPNINDYSSVVDIIGNCKETKDKFQVNSAVVVANDGNTDCPYNATIGIYKNDGGNVCDYTFCTNADANGLAFDIGTSSFVNVTNVDGVIYDSGNKDCNGSLARSVVVSVAAIVLTVLFASF